MLKKEPMSIMYSTPAATPVDRLPDLTRMSDKQALSKLGYAWAKEHAEKSVEYVYYDRVSEETRVYSYKIRDNDPISYSHKLIETRTKWVLK